MQKGTFSAFGVHGSNLPTASSATQGVGYSEAIRQATRQKEIETQPRHNATQEIRPRPLLFRSSSLCIGSRFRSQPVLNFMHTLLKFPRGGNPYRRDTFVYLAFSFKSSFFFRAYCASCICIMSKPLGKRCNIHATLQSTSCLSNKYDCR